MKEYLYEGKNEEELILKMLNELGVKEDEILYVKKEETVGLLKKKKVTIKAILKTDVLEYSKKFVTDLVNAMGLDVKLETKRGENNILIKLYSDNNPILIGKNGRTLMSIQNILHQSIYAKTGIHVNILLDASNYKEKKQKKRKNPPIHKAAAALTALALCAGVLTGCGGAASSTTASSTAGSAASSEVSGEEADELAAKNVADLIDAIYVQERTDDTDAQCEAAKAAWDALTDAQKELVEGEEADPDYFGRDTGDASKDDSRNQDDIGENELLVVSFGTSFNDSRVKDIKGIEDALQAAYPDWSVRRAFTAQIIINHVQARDGEKIDNMQQALDRAVANGVKNLVVQPTHLMHGAEYDEMMEMIDEYKDKFESVAVAEPLLGEVGADAAVINADKEAVAKAVTAAAVKDAGFDSLEAAAEEKVAFVFMGHGTSHTAKVSYSQMQTTMQTLGYDNVFIGTVEGKPEETACENVIEAVKAAGYTKVILRPLMVVAGDHANNDMAGSDDDSWLSMFNASDAFESVDCQIAGLGEIEDVQKLYVAHTKAAIDSLNG